MGKLVVKLSGCRVDGRSVDGEYGGGATVAEARKEAAELATLAPTGAITIYRVTKNGGLGWVEDYRRAIHWLTGLPV